MCPSLRQACAYGVVDGPEGRSVSTQSCYPNGDVWETKDFSSRHDQQADAKTWALMRAGKRCRVKEGEGCAKSGEQCVGTSVPINLPVVSKVHEYIHGLPWLSPTLWSARGRGSRHAGSEARKMIILARCDGKIEVDRPMIYAIDKNLDSRR